MHTNYNNARKAHPQPQKQINSLANVNGVYQKNADITKNYPHSALPNGSQPSMKEPYSGPHNRISGNAFGTAAPITNSPPNVVGGESEGESTFEYCSGLWREAEGKAGTPLWQRYAPVVKDPNAEPSVRNFVPHCSTQPVPEDSGVIIKYSRVQSSDTPWDISNTGMW